MAVVSTRRDHRAWSPPDERFPELPRARPRRGGHARSTTLPRRRRASVGAALRRRHARQHARCSGRPSSPAPAGALAALEEAIRTERRGGGGEPGGLRLGAGGGGRPGRLEGAHRRGRAALRRRSPTASASSWIWPWTGVTGELRRIVEVRVPDSSRTRARRYARRTPRRCARVRSRSRSGCRAAALAEAVARHLYKLMAYKDEYEVARLHLDPSTAQVDAGVRGGRALVTSPAAPASARTGEEAQARRWFVPVSASCGHAPPARHAARPVRLAPRCAGWSGSSWASIARQLSEALATLTPDNHGIAVALAELPDMVRGYEEIKLENVGAIARRREGARRFARPSRRPGQRRLPPLSPPPQDRRRPRGVTAGLRWRDGHHGARHLGSPEDPDAARAVLRRNGSSSG